jgi:hypothetical protein
VDTSQASNIAGGSTPADNTDVAPDSLQDEGSGLAGGGSPDTSEASGLAGGTQPDSTSFDPNDPINRLAANLPGGQPIESPDIAGGGPLSDLSPEDQQKALESTFGVNWWENPDQLGSDEREFLNKMLSGDPPEWWQEWRQDLLGPKTEASTSELTSGQKQVVESVFADDWLDFSERTPQQEELIENFLDGPDTPDEVDTTTDISQQPFGGSDTNQTSGAAGDFPGGELDGSESGVQGGDEMAEQETESSPVNEAAQPGYRVDVVNLSEGLWSSAEDMVDSGDITRDQFMDAWGNPDSTVVIDGQEKHISQVDLVHRGDTLVYVPGEDGDPPRFELDTASRQEAGLDLPGEATADQGVEAAESEPASGQQPELAGGDLSDVNNVDSAGLAAEDFAVPEHVDGVTADSKPANGITKGAIHSYTKALAEPAYDPEYLSSLEMPDGVNEQQFAQYINELRGLDQPLQHLSDIAENEPDKYRSLQTLFESYAEANMTPPGVDVSGNADLEGLYDAVQQHINDNAPAPEPPADDAGSQSSEAPGWTSSQDADIPEQSEPSQSDTGNQPEGGDSEQASDDTPTGSEDESSPSAGGNEPQSQSRTDGSAHTQGGDGEIQVDTGEDAVGAEAGAETPVSGEVIADPTPEDMSQLLSENTELNFYPQHLAGNMLVKQPPELSVPSDQVEDLVKFLNANEDKELVSMIDYLAKPDSQASPQHLATMSELFDYHLENPDNVTLPVQVDNSHVKTMDNYVEKMLKQAMDQAESDRVWEEIDNAQEVYDDLDY